MNKLKELAEAIDNADVIGCGCCTGSSGYSHARFVQAQEWSVSITALHLAEIAMRVLSDA